MSDWQQYSLNLKMEMWKRDACYVGEGKFGSEHLVLILGKSGIVSFKLGCVLLGETFT